MSHDKAVKEKKKKKNGPYYEGYHPIKGVPAVAGAIYGGQTLAGALARPIAREARSGGLGKFDADRPGYDGQKMKSLGGKSPGRFNSKIARRSGGAYNPADRQAHVNARSNAVRLKKLRPLSRDILAHELGHRANQKALDKISKGRGKGLMLGSRKVAMAGIFGGALGAGFAPTEKQAAISAAVGTAATGGMLADEATATGRVIKRNKKRGLKTSSKMLRGNASYLALAAVPGVAYAIRKLLTKKKKEKEKKK